MPSTRLVSVAAAIAPEDFSICDIIWEANEDGRESTQAAAAGA